MLDATEAKLGAMDSDPKETKNLLENGGTYKIIGSNTVLRITNLKTVYVY